VPGFEITLSDRIDAEAEIRGGLIAFNVAVTGTMPRGELQLAIRDPGTGRVLGGLTGRYAYRWLFVELLHVPEALRGTGIGTDLMRRAEAEALARGCIGVWLDTFSFQARGFYERLGYAVFGTIEDYPPGHARHFLAKRLGPG